MFYQQSRQAYQTVAGEGATQVGLTQHVYSFLAKDLLRAAQAVREHDIEGRCAASNHALLLLGHLESWLGFLEEPVLESSLQDFYGSLRAGILQAQVHPDPEVFTRAAQHILDTKSAWQTQEREAARSFQSGSVTMESPRAMNCRA